MHKNKKFKDLFTIRTYARTFHPLSSEFMIHSLFTFDSSGILAQRFSSSWNFLITTHGWYHYYNPLNAYMEPKSLNCEELDLDYVVNNFLFKDIEDYKHKPLSVIKINTNHTKGTWGHNDYVSIRSYSTMPSVERRIFEFEDFAWSAGDDKNYINAIGFDKRLACLYSHGMRPAVVEMINQSYLNGIKRYIVLGHNYILTIIHQPLFNDYQFIIITKDNYYYSLSFHSDPVSIQHVMDRLSAADLDFGPMQDYLTQHFSTDKELEWTYTEYKKENSVLKNLDFDTFIDYFYVHGGSR